jgi:hypothetical protein
MSRPWIAVLVLASAALSSCAPRQPVAQATPGANAAVSAAANAMVGTMNTLSCSRFRSLLGRMLPSGSAGDPDPTAAPGLASRLRSKATGAVNAAVLNTIKNNPEQRAAFVNMVAGPLANKMIDCNLLPGLE